MRLLLFALLLAAPAHAVESPDLVTRAKQHYEAGRALYQLSKYDQALTEFEEGYRLAPRTSFLVNIAQCHRQLGHPREARAMYEKFLAAAAPDDPMRAAVRDILRTLESPPAVPPPPPIVAEPPRRPWHRDPAGGVLLAGGAASIVVGVALLAWSADRLAHARDSYQDYLSALGAPDARIAGGVVLGAGVVLVAGGGARYALVRRH